MILTIRMMLEQKVLLCWYPVQRTLLNAWAYFKQGLSWYLHMHNLWEQCRYCV